MARPKDRPPVEPAGKGAYLFRVALIPSSFFMSGKRWDPSTEYASPFADEGRKAHQAKIDSLRLKPTQRFLYLFDYGDELMHEVRLMGVAPAVARQRYPRIVESHGKAPPQYPDVEEE